jgi:hypothetical protein
MRCGMLLHLAVVDPDYTGEENGEKRNEEESEGKNVLAGEVSHRGSHALLRMTRPSSDISRGCGSTLARYALPPL